VFKSLRVRIFLSMLLLVVGASILIVIVTIFQYKEEAEDYHRDRLIRKEQAVRQNINYILRNAGDNLSTEDLVEIFKEKIYEIKDIHNIELYLYDLEGKLLISSKATFSKDTTAQYIPNYVMNALDSSLTNRYIEAFIENKQEYQSSYTYITDRTFRPLAILNMPYVENDDFIKKELKENLSRLTLAYLFMLIIAIIMAYFLTKYITKSLNEVSVKLKETTLNKRNTKIEIKNASSEIATLVTAYNSMIDELEHSAAQLAVSEREAAWREMAKQVAHEIKNPLTPMRLSAQSLQRNFNIEDPSSTEKVNAFTTTLIQQIDTLSSIASAFSMYAEMPAQQEETLDVVQITKMALDIFNEPYIVFQTDVNELLAVFDRTQLIRVITNMVKNSIQAISQETPQNPKILVRVLETDEHVKITVEDNGIGILEENAEKVFELKFTTKTSGMGLGLAMVKKIVETYNGTVSFVSLPERGTRFIVQFPKLS